MLDVALLGDHLKNLGVVLFTVDILSQFFSTKRKLKEPMVSVTHITRVEFV